ncbi:DUF1720 domain-containing protein [Bacillus cereus]|uniref:DUF1720 domain-containing protein n=1 Tax=Bacillus cereus TaxID=1396 RepID=UPI003D17FA5E
MFKSKLFKKKKVDKLSVEDNIILNPTSRKQKKHGIKNKLVFSALSLSLFLPMLEPLTAFAEPDTGAQTQQPAQPTTPQDPNAGGGQPQQPNGGGQQPQQPNGSGTGENSNDARKNNVTVSKMATLGVSSEQGYKADMANISGNELRTLGVFVSNFYVPFSTQMGNVKDDKDEKEVQDNIVKALTETNAFEKGIAEKLSKVVSNVSKQSVQPLYFAQSTDGDKFEPVEGGDGKKGKHATFYDFLDQISGYAYKRSGSLPYPDLKDGVKADQDGMISVYKGSVWNFDPNSKKNEGALYWGSKDKVDKSHIMFNWNPASSDGNGQTASQTVMAEIYKYLDPENSVGTSFLDYTEKERGKGEKGKTVSKMLEEEKFKTGSDIKNIYQRSMYDWKMYVDAIGNILVDTGKRQYVVVPAAMNPFLFKKKETDGEGKEIDYGRSVPINNLLSISLASKGNLVTGKPTQNTAYFNLGNIYDKFSKDTEYKQPALYKFPGTKDVDWSEGKMGTSLSEGLLDALTTQFAVREYGMPKDKDWGEWLKRTTESKIYSEGDDIQKYGKDKLKEYKKFPYSFNTNELKGNDAVYAPRSGLNPKPGHFIIGDLVAFDNLGALNTTTTPPAQPQEGQQQQGGNQAQPQQPQQTPATADTSSDGKPLTLDSYKKNYKVIAEKGHEVIKRTPNALWDKDGKPLIDYNEIGSDGAFGEKLSPKLNEVSVAKNQIARDYSANIFVTYVFAALGGKEGVDKVGFELGYNRLPEFKGDMALEGVVTEADKKAEKEANVDELMNMAYYFLHPTEGISYFSRWAKTKIGAFFVGWHNDMTGASNAQNTTGYTRYIGFNGFTTMPSLSDMQWTDWMVKSYLDWGIYLIIFVVVIMIFYVAIGEISIQRAILGVGIFSLCLYLPPIAINSSVEFTNSVSNSIYGKKFLYWGIVQQQTYAKKIDEVAKKGEEGKSDDYTMGLMKLQGENNKGLYADNTSIGRTVTLKWMAPKKDNYLYQIEQEIKGSTGNMSPMFQRVLNNTLAGNLSGERYVDSNEALYLYRTYTDIGNYARYYYGNLMGDKVYDTGTVNHNIGDTNASMGNVGMTRQYESYMQGTKENSLTERKEKGFINDEQDAIHGASTDKTKLKRLYAPLSSEPVSKASQQNISKVNVGDEVGLRKDYFNVTFRNFNNHGQSLQEQIKGGSSASSENLASTASFALYTESPFYYFSWFLYDNGMKYESGKHDTFRNLMMKDNDSFFYNYKIKKESSGYGDLKDYMDMGSMFHTVIPYLREVNKPLKEWSSIYGTKPYPEIPTKEEDFANQGDKDSEEYYKYWFNISLARLFNTYTPWVDAMYDTDYAKPENITYGGKKQTIIDPINPKSYEIRPMVFSESEMAYYGLKEYNLTTVESKIIKVQRQTRNDLLRLMNYYNFDDNVLNQTASMIMTFNFNKEFSQENFITESFVQYPQSFELKNFSYDAYLRLILAQTTGESITGDDGKLSIYDRVVEKSSILTGILLVLGDIVAIYGIPTMKFVFLVLVFVLSVITIFVKALRAEISFRKVVWQALAKPLIQFCGVTLGHSLVISFFMSEGLTDVTGKTTYSIALGDPVMTLVVLLLINIVTLVLYSFIIMGLVRSLIVYGKLAGTIVGGIVASAGTFATSTASKVAGGVSNKMFDYGGSDAQGRTAPSSTSANADPQTRGSRNVEPELSVREDMRYRRANEEAYNKKEQPKDNTNVEEMINRGRQNFEETQRERYKEQTNHSNDLNNFDLNRRDTHEHNRQGSANGRGNVPETESLDELAQSRRENYTKDLNKPHSSSRTDAQREIDRKKAEADEVKKKYNLDD